MRRAPPVTSALLPCSEPSMSALNSRVNSPHARPACQRDRTARLDLVRALPAAVLHEPGLGYYAGSAQKFGRAGDFVTAPELGKLFGRTLARQLGQIGG